MDIEIGDLVRVKKTQHKFRVTSISNDNTETPQYDSFFQSELEIIEKYYVKVMYDLKEQLEAKQRRIEYLEKQNSFINKKYQKLKKIVKDYLF